METWYDKAGFYEERIQQLEGFQKHVLEFLMDQAQLNDEFRMALKEIVEKIK